MNSTITPLRTERVDASQIPIERLAANKAVGESAKAGEVARQFESVLLRQILESAHKTGVKGLFDDGSPGKDVYLDMMNYHLADAISRGGGLGLASALEAQLRPLLEAPGGDAGEDLEQP